MQRGRLLALGTFAVGTDLFVLGGILPDMARSLRVSEAAAGQAIPAALGEATRRVDPQYRAAAPWPRS